MPLDICVDLPTTYPQAKEAMERALRWVKRCKMVSPMLQQILFGIVQGAAPGLTKTVCKRPGKHWFPAYEFVRTSETLRNMTTLEVTTDLLPKEKLRYIMGVGRPEAMLEAVAAGVDIMDSIIPTKYARERTLFTYRGTDILAKRAYWRDTINLTRIASVIPAVT